MSEFDCTSTTQYDSAGVISAFCVTCPEVLAITAVAEQILIDNRYGWNADARSVVARAGDCYTEFSVPDNVVGVVCGLGRDLPGTDPRDVPHGFYIYQDSGRELWCVVESAVAKTAPVVRDPLVDLFRIERRSGTVRYFFNSHVLYTSLTSSTGELIALACLFAAGDGVD